jgi:hypothetical protein
VVAVIIFAAYFTLMAGLFWYIAGQARYRDRDGDDDGTARVVDITPV